MADFTADFEAGVNGNAITTGAGEASATAWNATNGSPVYDNTHKMHGALAGKFTSVADYVEWNLTSTTDHYGRIYFYAAAAPSDRCRIMIGGANAALLVVETNGKLNFQDVNGTNHFSAGALTFGQFYRIEYHVVCSGTVGQLEYKYFVGDSTSAVETITSTADQNTGASNTIIRFGQMLVGYGAAIWLDDIVANATSYPGPLQSSANYTILNGSDEQLSNVNAGGTDIDAASYKDGVTLTETELATLLDGTSFGKKNIAVLPNLTGVADARQIKKTTFSAETESA